MDFPITGKANVDWKHKDIKLTYDADVFPTETNKITKIGIFRPKKFLVKCTGDGHMTFNKLQDPVDQIERSSKLKDKKIITDEEFEEKKKELLDNL